ncbi:unnamed protein product [Caenorhabditis auriculariae]|uniref:Secreted protein n=1 Tax=Caenorhabditis auriculariae TaxID=2777116 RepID=A0A8S1GVS8_9PELO|nr:unnamed protein product [Caenorhabditis auriculariae]
MLLLRRQVASAASPLLCSVLFSSLFSSTGARPFVPPVTVTPATSQTPRLRQKLFVSPNGLRNNARRE